MGEARLSVLKLPKTNTLIIRQSVERGFFMSSDNVIVIDTTSLSTLLKLLIISGNLDKKVLEGILSELTE